MKKLMMYATALIFAVAVVSCSKSSEQAKTEEIPIAGTEYVITKTPEGMCGIKQGDQQLIDNAYVDIAYDDHQMFVASYASNMAGVDIHSKMLLSPENGSIVLSGDSISWHPDGYYIAYEKNYHNVYFPATKTGFHVMNDYVISNDVILIKGYSGWGAFRTTQPNDTLIAPKQYYKKLVLLRGKKNEYLTLDDEGSWLLWDEKGNPTTELPASALKKYKKSKDWVDSKEGFVVAY